MIQRNDKFERNLVKLVQPECITLKGYKRGQTGKHMNKLAHDSDKSDSFFSKDFSLAAKKRTITPIRSVDVWFSIIPSVGPILKNKLA